MNNKKNFWNVIVLGVSLCFVSAFAADIKKMNESVAFGGGFGGNKTTGKLIYDGLKNHLEKLSLIRQSDNHMCYLRNNDVTIRHYSDRQTPNFFCDRVNEEHNNVYWNGEFHADNNNYSPDNDALFAGTVVKNLYQHWYGIPVVTDENGNTMMLDIVVHAPIDNAYWDGKAFVIGDRLTPLLLNILAHQVTHGFTMQHSNLNYFGQSGAINEAFSDMATQAAEFYAYGKNSWQSLPGRYMDKPSKDCGDKKPGDYCSIDDASQYYQRLERHYASGVYNRFFYLLATSNGWNVRKAFEVMLRANVQYWAPNTTFVSGACAVVRAAKDLGYSLDDVIAAANEVKIDASRC